MVISIASLIFCAVCAYTDYKYGLIFNKITLPTIGLGILLNCLSNGFSGLKLSIAGCAAGITLGMLFGITGGMGGGDIKLLAAFGALVGPSVLVKTTLVAIVLLGIFGAIKLGTQLLPTLKKYYYVLISAAGTKKLYLPQNATTMPFAPGFLVAALLVMGRLL